MFPQTNVLSDIKMNVSSHVETVVLLSNLKTDKHIEVELDMDELGCCEG